MNKIIILDGTELKEDVFQETKLRLLEEGKKLKEVSPGVWKTLKKFRG